MPTRKQNADLDFQSASRIPNLPSPGAPGDPVPLSYLQDYIMGRVYKDAVRVVVGANVTISSPGASLDGVTLTSGDRVLLNGQSTASQNGPYVFNGAGSALTRTTDFDTSAEAKSGSVFPILEGTSADKIAILTTDGTITLGSTSLSFTVLGTSGITYGAGNGLSLAGSTFSVTPNGSSIDVSSSGVKIADAAGGAGLTVSSGIVSVGAGTGITVTADAVTIDTAVVARKTTGLGGNGSATALTLTHNLGNQYPIVQVVDVNSGYAVDAEIAYTSTNVTTVNFQAAPATNQIRITAIG